MSEKDSYWFRHDASAGRGLKMRKMAHIYSHWGKGIYWDVVEILRDQTDYKFESDDSSLQLLCDLVGCRTESRFLSWFRDCLRIGLFIEEEGFFFCPPLSKNMVRWEASKNNGSKGGRPPKEPKSKPKKNLNNNLKKTIIEEDSTEEEIVKATYFLNSSVQYETFVMQNKSMVKEWDRMLESYNDQIDLEVAQNKISFNVNELMPRLRKYCRSWISNQKDVNSINDKIKIPL